MGSAAEDIASGVMAKWAAGFSKLDADVLSSLYSKHALFFGSNPNLYRGRIAREDFDWKIVSHHVSSKAPLI